MPQVQLSQEPALALDVQVPSPISRLNRFHRGKDIHNPLRFYIFTSSSIIIMMQNQKKKANPKSKTNQTLPPPLGIYLQGNCSKKPGLHVLGKEPRNLSCSITGFHELDPH